MRASRLVNWPLLVTVLHRHRVVRTAMPELLAQLSTTVIDDDGNAFGVLAYGEPQHDGRWQAWLEFVSVDGPRHRSPRETTQPDRAAAIYWATGLTPVFIEGAFARAGSGPGVTDGTTGDRRPRAADAKLEPRRHADAVLDPFSIYQKGEALLRQQLRALSSWHLVNIIVAYELSAEPQAVLDALPAPALVDLIVGATRNEADSV
jgi:hypothetical protein